MSEENEVPEPRKTDEPGEAAEGFAERVDAAVELLKSVGANRAQLAALDEERRTALLKAAGEVARPGPWAKRELARASRRRRRQQIKEADERTLARSGIRTKRDEKVFATPVLVGRAPVPPGTDIDRALALPEAPSRRVEEPRNCYVCKKDYTELHHFYDSLCPPCAELNWRKRTQTVDLSGRVALLTGARVKIGYQAAIMMLRAGARVIVTTRFPQDATTRFLGESDAEDWRDRLDIHGLDLRHTPSVEAFAHHLGQTLERLDFILNNACQTVRRPAGFYSHLMELERQPSSELPEAARRLLVSHATLQQERRLSAGGESTALTDSPRSIASGGSAELSQATLLEEDLLRGEQIFPAGELDADLQQVDLRGRNSWRLGLSEVSAVEFLEVQLVNSVAPFILNARLKPLMLRQPSRDKHIVNVSAVEGQFYRSLKTDKHPHTNMAKAALNMMTRTSAVEYVKDGIHMNSVDTGWITDEDPLEIARRKTIEQGFHPPLDIVDGAARICDPIFDGFLTGNHIWGRFLKDYAPTNW